MSHSEQLRERYISAVTQAIAEYVERGGHLRFQSDRSGQVPLEIAFEFGDPDLYDSILLNRLERFTSRGGTGDPPRCL